MDAPTFHYFVSLLIGKQGSMMDGQGEIESIQTLLISPPQNCQERHIIPHLIGPAPFSPKYE
jgi:hypothetical protein